MLKTASKEAIEIFLKLAEESFTEFVRTRTVEEYDASAGIILESQRRGGRLHFTGIGKCSHVATYAASLFSSTGNPAYYLHGTEAVHGSCGQLAAGDVVVALSNSGETQELKATVIAVRNCGCKVIGVSGNATSWLVKNSDTFLFAGVSCEGGPMNRAPRNSVTAEILTLQTLSVALQVEKDWNVQEYLRCHPSGALGMLRENER